MVLAEPTYVERFFIIVVMGFHRFNFTAFFTRIFHQLAVFQRIADGFSCYPWQRSLYSGVVNAFCMTHTHLVGGRGEIATFTHATYAMYNRAEKWVAISLFTMIMAVTKTSTTNELFTIRNSTEHPVTKAVKPAAFAFAIGAYWFVKRPMTLHSKQMSIAKATFKNHLGVATAFDITGRIVGPPQFLPFWMFLIMSLVSIHGLTIAQWL